MERDRIQLRVVDEGDGCYRLEVATEEERQRLREVLASPCGVRVVVGEEWAPKTEEEKRVEEVAREAAAAVSTEEARRLVAEAEEEAEAEGETCPVDGQPWEESACGLLERRILAHLRKKLEEVQK